MANTLDNRRNPYSNHKRPKVIPAGTQVVTLVEISDQSGRLAYLDELVARKLVGAEASILAGDELGLYVSEYNRLHMALQEASLGSELPEEPACKAELNDLLLRIRLRASPGYPCQ